MKNKIINTDVVELILGEDGIMRHNMHKGAVLGLAAAEDLIAKSTQLSGGKKCPFLVKTSGTKSMSREARSFLSSSEESAKISAAVAFLITSPVTRVLANFFIGLNKPIFPVKLFTDEKNALAWLKGFVE